MSADIRPITSKDIPALLPLVEQYWIFEDVAGFDAARVTRELQRLCADPRSAAAGSPRSRVSRSATCSPSTSSAWSTSGSPPRSTSSSCCRPRGARASGDELLKLAEAEFIRRGCTNVALQLGKGNDRARVFYRAHGYGERAGFELLDKMLPGGP